MTPGSVERVMRSEAPSSTATAAIPSGMPMPRFTTQFGLSSMAARRAMILRSVISMVSMDDMGTRSSPL